MQIVVNDTNIFFDLMQVDLINLFFQLPFEVHTTDFVVGEIEEPEQEKIILQLIEKGQLTVAASGSDELDEIMVYHETDNRLSIPDCSVWYYSKTNKFTLLTGDNRLRKTAMKDQVEVRGILFIFDELVRLKLLHPTAASDKLKRLLEIGSRLPKDACDDRFERWSQ